MRAFLICLLALPAWLSAGDLRENTFFKALQGSWTGDWEFLSLDKPPSPVRNHIACAFSDDGTEFTIKGNLVIDGNPDGLRLDLLGARIGGTLPGALEEFHAA